MARWYNKRTVTTILLIAGAAVLQGCGYDPTTGTYVQCCVPYPAYSGYPYPAYGYFYGYPAYGGYYGGPG